RLVLVNGPNCLPNCGKDRSRLDSRTNHDPARTDHELIIGLVMQAINCRSWRFFHDDLVNLFHDTNDHVPVSLFTKVCEFEADSKRGASRKVAIGKGV